MTPVAMSPAPAPVSEPLHHRVPVIISIAVLVLVGIGITYYLMHKEPVAEQQVDPSGPDGIIKDADARLAQNPDDTDALIDKAYALIEKGTATYSPKKYTGDAIAAAQRAIAIDSKNVTAYLALGGAQTLAGDYASAHASYKQATALDSRFGVTNDARAYELEGDPANAKAGYAKAIAGNQFAYAAYLGLGRLAAAQGETEEAVKNFNKVYGYSFDRKQKARAAYGLGMLELAQGDADQARAYFNLAISYDDHYQSAVFGYGVALYAQSGAEDITAETRTMLTQASQASVNGAMAAVTSDGASGLTDEFRLDLAVARSARTQVLAALDSAKQALATSNAYSAEAKNGITNTYAHTEAVLSASAAKTE